MSKGLKTLSKDDFWLDALLFWCAFFLIFFALGWRGLWAAEGRWAQITREMLATGDFLHPTIGGRPYFDKPLLTYWLIAAASFLTGSLNEWIVRLPSAIAGVLAIWATKNIGMRLWSARVGRTAAWVLLTTYGVLFWSRTGTAETENLAAIILAVAWYWARRDKPNFSTFIVFYVIIFAGAWTKGLTAVIVPVLAVLPDVVRNRRWRVLLKPSHIFAMVFGVAIYLVPFVYASMTRPADYQADGLALVFRENVVRYFNPFDHKGPVYTYIYAIPALMFPWAPLWIAATAATIKIWKSLDDATRWLLKAGILIFIFFTLSGSRRSYYILPILPFCALLTAVFVVQIRDPRTNGFLRWGVAIQSGLLFGMVVLEFIVPLAMMVFKGGINIEFPRGILFATAVIGILALILNFMADKYVQRNPLYSKGNPSVLPSILLSVMVMGGYFCVQQTILNASRTERPFALDIEARVAEAPAESIALFRKNCPTMQFYLNRESPVQVLDDSEALLGFLEGEAGGVLITQRRYVAEVISHVGADFHAEPDMIEEIRPWDSEQSRAKKWVAWLLNKPIAKQESFSD